MYPSQEERPTYVPSDNDDNTEVSNNELKNSGDNLLSNEDNFGADLERGKA